MRWWVQWGWTKYIRPGRYRRPPYWGVQQYQSWRRGTSVTMSSYRCVVEDDCLIGMGAIVLDNALVGKGFVAASSCHGRHPNFWSLVMGSPAKVIRPVNDKDKWWFQAGGNLWRVRQTLQSSDGSHISRRFISGFASSSDGSSSPYCP